LNYQHFIYGQGIFEDRKNFNSGVGLRLEARCYYSLQKRIAQGKSANNLSGNYFSLRLTTSNIFEYNIYPKLIQVGTNGNGGAIFSISEEDAVEAGMPQILYLNVTSVWGFQKRIFKKGYIDYSIGLRAYTAKIGEPTNPSGILSLDPSGFLNFDNWSFSPVSQLRIGLAF